MEAVAEAPRMTAAIPRISIGMPTYNRPELLAQALECFRQQTFSNFELIVSDNASPNPDVRRICERYVEQDSRFRYVRQPVNQGADKNFWFVYDQTKAPLFVWASDDDLWPQDFLENGVAALDANPSASAWCCEVVNINIDGDFARSYPSNKRFQSTRLKFVDLAYFLWEPEIMGKSSLYYSIFRRPSLGPVIDIFRPLPTSWGNDMNIVYGFLCRSDVIIDDRLAMQKRLPTLKTDGVGPNPRLHIYPRDQRAIYFRTYRLAAAGSGYGLLTSAVLAARAPYDYWCSGRARDDYRNWPPKRHAEDWWKHNKGHLIRALERIWTRVRNPASKGRE
jgi:glycosyltransferase involved in cell wall biosynthesis